jgi:hypothetical protein
LFALRGNINQKSQIKNQKSPMTITCGQCDYQIEAADGLIGGRKQLQSGSKSSGGVRL